MGLFPSCLPQLPALSLPSCRLGSAKDAHPERSLCQGVGKITAATGLLEDQSLAFFYYTNQRARVALLLWHSWSAFRGQGTFSVSVSWREVEMGRADEALRTAGTAVLPCWCINSLRGFTYTLFFGCCGPVKHQEYDLSPQWHISLLQTVMSKHVGRNTPSKYKNRDLSYNWGRIFALEKLQV